MSLHLWNTTRAQCCPAPFVDPCPLVGYTALQLRNMTDRWVRQELGIVGLRLVWELRGISCLPLELCPPPKQSLMVSRSFGRPITTWIEMREAVATYMTREAEKLRRHHRAAG